MKLLIQNGRVIHTVTGTVQLQDVLVEHGRIAVLDRGITAEADRIIDRKSVV